MNGSKLCNSIILMQHSKEQQLFSKRIAIHFIDTAYPTRDSASAITLFFPLICLISRL